MLSPFAFQELGCDPLVTPNFLFSLVSQGRAKASKHHQCHTAPHTRRHKTLRPATQEVDRKNPATEFSRDLYEVQENWWCVGGLHTTSDHETLQPVKIQRVGTGQAQTLGEQLLSQRRQINASLKNWKEVGGLHEKNPWCIMKMNDSNTRRSEIIKSIFA